MKIFRFMLMVLIVAITAGCSSEPAGLREDFARTHGDTEVPPLQQY